MTYEAIRLAPCGFKVACAGSSITLRTHLRNSYKLDEFLHNVNAYATVSFGTGIAETT
jgi:hypothetical protein